MVPTRRVGLSWDKVHLINCDSRGQKHIIVLYLSPMSKGQEDPREEENGNQFQYTCLGNPMDRGAWQATVKRVTRSQT